MDTLKRALGGSGAAAGAAGVAPTQQEKSTDYASLLPREQALLEARKNQPCTKTVLACTPESGVRLHPSKLMLASEWRGSEQIVLTTRIVRGLTDAADALVRVTSNTICGSDLHMYHNQVPGVGTMKEGDILGHECVGVVDEIGEGVKEFKVGDRVVVSAIIMCGECTFCKTDRPSLCDRTNPSGQLEMMYGHRLAGIFGYSHLTGGYSGSQAEYVRVPLADHNLLKVPEQLRDEQVLLLSDVMCTGWHALELAEVKQGSEVAIWGLGPVGMMAAYLAKTLKMAKRVVAIDKVPYRLSLARSFGVETLNFAEQDVFTELTQRLIPGGPEHCIDAAGFRFAKGPVQKIAPMIAEKIGIGATDTADIVSEVIKCCAKGGCVCLIGDYFGNADGYPVGMQMEKSITMRGGQVYVQKYWKHLLSKIVDGSVDPTFLLTHHMDFEQLADAYKRFDGRQENSLKLHIHTAYGRALMQQQTKATQQAEQTVGIATATQPEERKEQQQQQQLGGVPSQ